MEDNVDKIELVQRIGDNVCEGCGPNADCGIDPSKCDRIDVAIDMIDEYVNVAGRKKKEE